MTKRLIIAGAVIAVFLGALVAFHYVIKPQLIRGFVASNPPPPASVATEPARTEQWVTRINSIGTLIAVRGVDIAPQVAGVVTKIQFESGDEVIEGAELVKLDDAVEQADLLSNKATLRDAILEFERHEDLRRRDVSSEARLEEARAKKDSAAAAVQRTRAQIEHKTIKAPFAGRLGIRKVELGQYVSPGSALVTLQALDPIRVDFPVPEKDIDQLQPGQTIEIAVDTFPGETFEGRIETLDARVSQETRTLVVRGLISNPDSRLLPGMFANVAVLAGDPQQVTTVPRTAVSYSLYGDSIYVVKPNGAKGQAGETQKKEGGNPKREVFTVERRFVRVGENQDDRVAIGEGISPGEMVVTSGQLKLRPGAKVTINNETPLTAPAVRPKQ